MTASHPRLPYSENVNASTWKAWLVPGGLLLALTATLVNSALFQQVAPSLSFYYVAAFAAGFLLAWRFNSSRVLFSLIVLLLAHRAVDFFAAGHQQSGPSRMAIALAALLVPLNFVVLAAMQERGLRVAGIAPRFGLLFIQSVVFAILCRPENSAATLRPATAPAIPLWIYLSFVLAIAFFIRRFFQTRKPIEPGFVWSLAASFLWLQFAPLGKISDAYVATAALILAASLVETSYVLAYHDELTGIRGRRAFNESLLALDQQYAIAIVDIDHFKKFNDTYGHDVGDQVLCMVASRLTEVAGDGQAYRCGGEEFAIVFRNTSAKEAAEHLEKLREKIENSSFRVRGSDRRARKAAEAELELNAKTPGEAGPRKVPEQRRLFEAEQKPDQRAKQSDRRKSTSKKPAKVLRRDSRPRLSSAAQRRDTVPAAPSDHLSVTVSIGVAEASTRYRQPEQVIQSADQALYRAKHKGRNRVEQASTAPLKLAERRRVKTSRS